MFKTSVVKIRSVNIGGGNPIVIQSMTDTDTADPTATAKQAIQLANSGSELVRITVNDEDAARAVPKIREILDHEGYSHLPLIGDFHFNGHDLLKDFPKLATTLDKYRINPGNVGYGEKHNYNFSQIIEIAKEYDKAIRIGVNWGSLDRDLLTELMNQNARKSKPSFDRGVIIQAMIESALRSAKLACKLGLKAHKIVLSVKMSEVPDVTAAYTLLAKKLQKQKLTYPLHLGLTEAGSGMKGLISSSAALAILLNKNIGDTIRISLTPSPGQPRTAEVEACKVLLQSMDLRHFQPQVTSCPGCGRTDSKFFQQLAQKVQNHLQKKMPIWIKQKPAVKNLKIAVMGCIVNGPGESRYADIGISLPGKKEKELAPVYIKGKFFKTLKGQNIAEQFIELLEDYIEKEL